MTPDISTVWTVDDGFCDSCRDIIDSPHSVLAHVNTVLVYWSETGTRVMRRHLVNVNEVCGMRFTVPGTSCYYWQLQVIAHTLRPPVAILISFNTANIIICKSLQQTRLLLSSIIRSWTALCGWFLAFYALHSAQLPWLPVLTNTPPPNIQRKAACDKLLQIVENHPEWPELTKGASDRDCGQLTGDTWQGINDLPSAWRNGRASDYSGQAALLLMSL